MQGKRAWELALVTSKAIAMTNSIRIAGPATVPCPREPGPKVTRSGVLGCWLVAALAACNGSPTDGPAPGGKTESATDPQSASYRPPPTASIEIVEVPDTGISLGWGWNSVDNEPVPTICVQFVEGNELAQTRYMTMSEVSDSYELMQSMGMSAAASVKTIGFAASGKAKFAKDLNITGFSSNFVMNASVENGVRFAAPVPANWNTATADVSLISERGGRQGEIRLTPEARKLAGKRDPTEFLHLCGNAFVSAIFSGAKLTGVITIETQSQEQQETLSAEMAGAGWGARFHASMEQSGSSATKGKNMHISIFQTGGRRDSIPVTSADLIKKLEVLSALAEDARKDFHMAVMPYETLSNWPAASLLVEENEYDELASYWGSYNTLYDEIQYALDHPALFIGATMTNGCVELNHDRSLTAEQIERLEQVQDDVLDALHRLQRFAQHCATSESGCEFPEGQFRSPYAYRIQLPLSKQESALTVDTLVTSHISDPAKQRCNIAKDNPGCLSNAEIHDWRDKIGMELLTFTALDERDALAAKLLTRKLTVEAKNCGNYGTRARATFSVEPEFPALWYDPRIKTCIEHPDAAAPPGQCPPS